MPSAPLPAADLRGAPGSAHRGARLPKSRSDPAFKTKPQIARELVDQAQEDGIPFAAIVAASFYGDHLEFEAGLQTTGLPYVLAVKPAKGH